jgi:PAS domain S-box-containing protein
MLQQVVDWLVDPAGLTPHGFCLLWEPGLIWTHAIADSAIALSYYTIPLALIIFAKRRRDLVFRPVFALFAAFILLCGTVHWLDVLTLWVPAYGLQAAVKACTALVSAVTAVALWRLLPHALALPSPAQLRRVNDALRESEARHRASFEHSPVPLHTLDGNGIITGVSQSWLNLLGYRSAEVVGRHVNDFRAGSTTPWEATDKVQLLHDGEVREVEQRYRRRDGTMVDFLASSRLERRADTIWVVCVLVDITARKQAEAALRAGEERLRHAQKMEAVGQLTGGIAHDFNNMLQGIGGCLELMERRVAEGRAAEVARYVGPARQSVDRAAGLTHRMLAFARRQALQPRSIDPNQLIAGIEDLIQRTVGPATKVVFRLQENVCRTLCDPNQLESALLNLTLNARDAMPDGGVLTVSTVERTLGRDDLAEQNSDEPGSETNAAPGHFVEISFSDTGFGMTPHIMARVFEPFFTTKPIGQGTGLGLSQIYGFVRQSGGLVRLQSTPKQGTTVSLFLPRDVTDEAPTNVAHAHSKGDPVGGTVLVVEDEGTVRDLITEILEELGCRVLSAEDGLAGLRLVQSQQRVDLLITDIGLPGMNGRQLADAARQTWQRLPVLLITGFAGYALEENQLAPGMEVLVKPFKVAALADRVRQLLATSLV